MSYLKLKDLQKLDLWHFLEQSLTSKASTLSLTSIESCLYPILSRLWQSGKWKHVQMCAYGLFREINFKKIGVSLISRKISSEVLIYHLYFGLVNFLLLHYLGHRNWNLVQRHPNQDHLTMMSWSDHFLSAGMWTYLIEDNWLHWERTKTYK